MLGCTQCGRPTTDRWSVAGVPHWLCVSHRKQRGLDCIGGRKSVTEAFLVRNLLFDFPASCEPREATARARFAAQMYVVDDRVRAVIRTYRIRATHVTRGIGIDDRADFFERLVLFVCALVPSAHLHVARVVGKWYPCLLAAYTPEMIGRAESVLTAVTGATGVRSFLVRADLAPLHSVLFPELVDLVYLAYIRLIATRASSRSCP